MRGKPWTDKRLDLLRRLWMEGESAAAIAARLRVSRAAVLGKVHRLRLGPGGEKRPRADESELRRRDSGRPAKAPDDKQRRGKTLLELDNRSCRWPLGEPGTPRFHYCGEPGADLENGCPYCERHMGRAYVAHGKGSSAPAEQPGGAGKTKSPAIVPPAKRQDIAKALRRRA